VASRSDLNAVIRRVLACPHGWKYTGYNSTGHPVYQLPDGRRVTVSGTPGDVNTARNIARQFADVCGCDTFWARAGIGKPRGTGHHTDFDPAKAARETEVWRQENPDYESLPRQHAMLLAELQALDPRRQQADARLLAESLVALETEMDEKHIYYERGPR